jgi:hypothetical protein
MDEDNTDIFVHQDDLANGGVGSQLLKVVKQVVMRLCREELSGSASML